MLEEGYAADDEVVGLRVDCMSWDGEMSIIFNMSTAYKFDCQCSRTSACWIILQELSHSIVHTMVKSMAGP